MKCTIVILLLCCNTVIGKEGERASEIWKGVRERERENRGNCVKSSCNNEFSPKKGYIYIYRYIYDGSPDEIDILSV